MGQKGGKDRGAKVEAAKATQEQHQQQKRKTIVLGRRKSLLGLFGPVIVAQEESSIKTLQDIFPEPMVDKFCIRKYEDQKVKNRNKPDTFEFQVPDYGKYSLQIINFSDSGYSLKNVKISTPNNEVSLDTKVEIRINEKENDANYWKHDFSVDKGDFTITVEIKGKQETNYAIGLFKLRTIMFAERISIRPAEWLNLRHNFDSSGIYQVIIERETKNEFELLTSKITNSFCCMLKVLPQDYAYSVDHLHERFTWESNEFEVFIDGKEDKQMELMISCVEPHRHGGEVEIPFKVKLLKLRTLEGKSVEFGEDFMKHFEGLLERCLELMSEEALDSVASQIPLYSECEPLQKKAAQVRDVIKRYKSLKKQLIDAIQALNLQDVQYCTSEALRQEFSKLVEYGSQAKTILQTVKSNNQDTVSALLQRGEALKQKGTVDAEFAKQEISCLNEVLHDMGVAQGRMAKRFQFTKFASPYWVLIQQWIDSYNAVATEELQLLELVQRRWAYFVELRRDDIEAKIKAVPSDKQYLTILKDAEQTLEFWDSSIVKLFRDMHPIIMQNVNNKCTKVKTEHTHRQKITEFICKLEAASLRSYIEENKNTISVADYERAYTISTSISTGNQEFLNYITPEERKALKIDEKQQYSINSNTPSLPSSMASPRPAQQQAAAAAEVAPIKEDDGVERYPMAMLQGEAIVTYTLAAIKNLNSYINEQLKAKVKISDITSESTPKMLTAKYIRKQLIPVVIALIFDKIKNRDRAWEFIELVLAKNASMKKIADKITNDITTTTPLNMERLVTVRIQILICYMINFNLFIQFVALLTGATAIIPKYYDASGAMATADKVTKINGYIAKVPQKGVTFKLDLTQDANEKTLVA